jgi:hypothetical protein
MNEKDSSATNSQQKKPNQPQQGLIQEVAIGQILSDQMITESQVKKG